MHKILRSRISYHLNTNKNAENIIVVGEQEEIMIFLKLNPHQALTRIFGCLGELEN